MAMHNGAVLCVRWSSDGRYLASGSDNDNVIIIWELDRLNSGLGSGFGDYETNHETWRAVKYLRGHESGEMGYMEVIAYNVRSDVQDIAWSKDSHYLASCGADGLSDDKMVKIWRTSDWGLEKDIKGPFINAPGTTMFRRLSWSPNASHIAAANAVNGIQCVAAIIQRDDWTSDVSLIGHKLPIEVTAFNPKLFYVSEDGKFSEPGSAEGETLATICALGGQDSKISIWVTNYSRPLCVASDVFENNVYDIAWAPDGKSLFACSQDGTIACLQLHQELTHVAPNEQMLKQLSKYGYDRRNAILPEAPSQLDLEEENAIITKTASSKRIADLMGANSTASEYQINAAIQPVTPGNGVDSGQPPKITLAPQPSDADFTSSSTAALAVSFEQTVTVMKDGKRRIQPVHVSSNGPSGLQIKSSIENSLSKRPGNKPSTPPTATQLSAMEDVEYSCPSTNLPSSGIGAVVTGNKRKIDEVQSGNADRTESAPRRKPAWVDAGLISPMVSQSQVKLGIPTVKATIAKRIPSGDKSIMIECYNTTGKGENNDYSKIVAISQGSPIWSDYVSSAIVLITGNDMFTAIGCEDGTLHVYSPAGRRLIPPIVLESSSVFLHSSDQWLLCLTSTGLVYTWDIPHERSCLAAVSIAPILRVALLPSTSPQVAPTIRDVRVQKNGVPLMITSYQQAFMYHLNMNMWLRISDPWYIVSEFWDSAANPGKDRASAHPLGWLA
ncbi:HIR complex subunit, partial [Apophysomyces sp. BC1034]